MFGISNLSGESITSAQLLSMRQTLNNSNEKHSTIWHKNQVAILEPSTSPLTMSLNKCQLGTFRISVKSHLVNKAELIQMLELRGSLIAGVDDQLLILLAYQRWGESCVNFLHGEFVFAIWDCQRQSLFCARDRMGIYPFFYYWHQNIMIFGNAMEKIVQIPDIQLTANPFWIVDHLCVLWLDKEQTFYNEINRLPPAHTLTVSSKGIQKNRYWDFDRYTEINLNTNEAYFETARNKLFLAVKRCLEPFDSIGIELSGGLDSTTIAAIAQKERKHHSERQLSAFSHASPPRMVNQQGYRDDERQAINSACEYTGITAKHFFTNSDCGLIPLLEKAIMLGGGVDRCDFSTLTGGIHELAASKGINIMLSGLGGDHLVSSRIQTRNYLLRNRSWKLLWSELSLGGTNSIPNTIWQLLKSGLSEYGIPSGKTKQQIQKKRREQKKAIIESMLRNCPELQSYIAEINWRQRIDDAWDNMNSNPPKTIREAQVKLISQPVLTNRLEATAQIAASVGIEYRYPLLDIELMTFFLSLPPDQVRRHGIGRYLFRCCSQDLLPDHIRWLDKFRGAQYPWYLHSLKTDIDWDIPPVADDMPEEVKISRLIAQARRVEQRKQFD